MNCPHAEDEVCERCREDWEEAAARLVEEADREAAAERSLEETLAESYDLRGDIREMIEDLPF